MAVKLYNAKQVSVIVGTRVLTGFAEDAMVTVERDEDSWTKQVGVDGETTRSRSNNNGGKVTIQLMQTSDDNDFLSGINQADEVSANGVLPITVRDQNGRTLCFSPSGWIMKPPSSEFNREATGREWVIDCAELAMFTGGNTRQ